MKPLPTIMVVLLALVASAHTPQHSPPEADAPLALITPTLHPDVQSELDALVRRGFTYRFIDNETIALTETWSGNKQVKSLREPSEAEIRAWAALRGVPILEIDPTQIDSNKYAGWYMPWIEVPLSNSEPLIVKDMDGNGKVEVYGAFKDWGTDFESHVYEVATSGVLNFVYEYIPRRGSARAIIDADKDSLLEIIHTLAGVVYDYEQPGCRQSGKWIVLL